MKTLNCLLVAAIAAVTFKVPIAGADDRSPERSDSPRNTALLASPRYLEEHPEFLRALPPAEDSSRDVRRAERLAGLTENRALASSPRFREDHPELLRAAPYAVQSMARAPERRMNTLTVNQVQRVSPRFLEEHPELSRGTPVLEVAPLK